MTDPRTPTSPMPRRDKPGHSTVFHLKAAAAGTALALVVALGVNVQAGGAGIAKYQTAGVAPPQTTLASLGAPTILFAVSGNTRVPAAGKGWINYRPAPPATLDIAGHEYAQGGQFTWTCYNDYNAAGYGWVIPKSKTFTTEVGEELTAPPAGVTLSFLGNGKQLLFVAKHKTMASLRVPLRSSQPVAVKVALTGVTKLIVVLTQVYTENTALENYTVDFGNALFSH